MSTPLLVLATANAHKVEEVKATLAKSFPEEIINRIVPISYFDGYSEPTEDGVTFTENALIKARAASQFTGLPALADDSGLSVDVLGGAPGVFSARWCGHHGSDADNRDLLLGQLQDVPDKHRGAAFVCAIALVVPLLQRAVFPNNHGDQVTTMGSIKGHLTTTPFGDGGFGYDPIFVPEGHKMTTAQMTAEEKNSLSHRGIALRKMVEPLEKVFFPRTSSR